MNQLRDELFTELMEIPEPSEAVIRHLSAKFRKQMLRQVALGNVGFVGQDDQGRRSFHWAEDHITLMEVIAPSYKPESRVVLEINPDGTFMAVHCAFDAKANEPGNWIESLELPDLDIWLDEVLGPPKVKA